MSIEPDRAYAKFDDHQTAIPDEEHRMNEPQVAEVAGTAVGSVHQVLVALQDPVRLEIVRRLRNAGTPMQCSALYEGINKSTATHHFKILREAGLTERVVADGLTYQKLRDAEIDATMPGLLDSVVGVANREIAP
jgi:DNA-binding transcriptional ArsR family regulator